MTFAGHKSDESQSPNSGDDVPPFLDVNVTNQGLEEERTSTPFEDEQDREKTHLDKSPSLLDLWDGKSEYQRALDIHKEVNYGREVNDPIPFRNLGNTCYMNSTVHTLFVLKYFLEDLERQWNTVKEAKKEGEFEMSYRLLKFFAIYCNQRVANEFDDAKISEELKKLKHCVGEKSSQFSSSMQQDAVEFMQLILSTIEDEFDKVKDIIPSEANPIRKWFTVEVESNLKCVKCGHEKRLPKETACAMYLCIPENVSHSFTLQKSVENYFKEEKTEHKCENKDCDSEEKMRYMYVSKLSTVLFLQLRRYSTDGTKRHEIVHVNRELFIPTRKASMTKDKDKNGHLHPSEDEETESICYKLVAAVCHYGSSLQGGHYSCYVYQSETQTWYLCDDDTVRKSSLEMAQEGIKTSGYYFLYVKKI